MTFVHAFFDELTKIAGHAGYWVKQRAKRIEESGGAAEPYAIAVQQAYKMNKTLKKTEKGGKWGTPEGKREALQKYDKPKKEYQKTP